MRNWLAVGVVGFVSTMMGAVGIGCSSSSPPTTVDSFCEQLAAAECPSVEGVCATVSDSTCAQTVAEQCENTAHSPEYANRTQINSNAIAACLSAISGSLSSLSSGSGELGLPWTKLNGTAGTAAPSAGSPNDYCNRVFQGDVALNGNCLTSYDCTDGNICGSNGTCGPENDRQSGEACSDPGDLCPTGSVCSQQGTLFLCGAGAQVGESCSAEKPCATSAECKSGKCVALAEKGEPCSTNADCDPTQQSDGNYYGFCDVPNGGICTFGYTFGTNAPDCEYFSEVTPSAPHGSSAH